MQTAHFVEFLMPDVPSHSLAALVSEDFGFGLPAPVVVPCATLVFAAQGPIGRAACAGLRWIGHSAIPVADRPGPVLGGNSPAFDHGDGRLVDSEGAPISAEAAIVPLHDGAPEFMRPGVSDPTTAFAADMRRALRAGVRRVIVVSSLAAVGPRTAGECPAFEDAPERPVDAAGRALLAAEREAFAWGDRVGVTIVVLRPGALFGPGHPSPYLSMANALAGDETDGFRDLAARWLDIALPPLEFRDLGQAIALATDRGEGIYHTTTFVLRSVGAYALALAATARRAGLAMPGLPTREKRAALASSEARHWAFPSRRAAHELSFGPRYSARTELRFAVHEAMRRRLQAMEPDQSPPILFDGDWHRLDSSPERRASDLARQEVTLVRISDGSRKVYPAAAFHGGRSRRADAQRSFRTVIEDALRVGFRDRQLGEVAYFTARMGLIRAPDENVHG